MILCFSEWARTIWVWLICFISTGNPLTSFRWVCPRKWSPSARNSCGFVVNRSYFALTDSTSYYLHNTLAWPRHRFTERRFGNNVYYSLLSDVYPHYILMILPKYWPDSISPGTSFKNSETNIWFIPWISNYIHINLWHIIKHSCPNFKKSPLKSEHQWIIILHTHGCNYLSMSSM